MLPVAVIVPVTAVALSLRQDTLWEASAEVLLNERVAPTVGTLGDLAAQDPERYAETQVRIARTPALLEQVKRSTQLNVPMLERSDVNADPEANVLEFRVRDGRRRAAAALANSYARSFTRYSQELGQGSVYQARLDVLKRLDDLRERGHGPGNLLFDALQREARQLQRFQNLQVTTAVPLKLARAATTEKVQPRPVRAGLVGAALGIALAIGIALLREVLDTRIRHADDIHRRLAIPLLSRIPRPPRRLRRQNRLVMVAEPNGSDAEAFRGLRTNLELRNLTRRARTILITSALEAEGKSTTVANLAVALARAGRRVVLVDLDLRKPTLHGFFGLSPGPGVTDVALGDATLDEALMPVPLGGAADSNGQARLNGRLRGGGSLRLLRAGAPAADPGEFVETPELAQILASSAEQADILLVDSTPLLHVGDAVALSTKVDALVVVARLERLRRPALNELQRILDACPATALGFVLTGAESGETYGYSSYYSEHQRAAVAPDAEHVG